MVFGDNLLLQRTQVIAKITMGRSLGKPRFEKLKRALVQKKVLAKKGGDRIVPNIS